MTERSDIVPTCSILCLTYNHRMYSDQALRSIFAQDYRKIEIIVVDDGSEDGNQERIQKTLTESSFPFRFIQQENTGNTGLNLNRAIKAASGSYISFFSLDDILLPGSISSKMKIMLADPNVAFVANSSNIIIDGNGNTTNSQYKSAVHGKQVLSARELLELEYNSIGTFFLQGAVIDSDLIRAVCGFDPDISGDDIVLRTKMFKHLMLHPDRRFVFIPEAGMAYRIHSDNLHKNTWHQVKTVIDWKTRFYPNRPFPPLALKWIDGYIFYSTIHGLHSNLSRLAAYCPELEQRFVIVQSTWKFRLHIAKYKLRRLFAMPATKKELR